MNERLDSLTFCLENGGANWRPETSDLLAAVARLLHSRFAMTRTVFMIFLPLTDGRLSATGFAELLQVDLLASATSTLSLALEFGSRDFFSWQEARAAPADIRLLARPMLRSADVASDQFRPTSTESVTIPHSRVVLNGGTSRSRVPWLRMSSKQ